MLETLVVEQARVLALMVLSGIFMGLLFDVFRVSRQFYRPSRLVLAFSDLFFWLLAAGFVFLVLLAGNWGEVRAYVFIGLGTGGLLYALFVSPACYRAMVLVVKAILSFCRVLFGPFLRLWQFLQPILGRAEKVAAGSQAYGRQQLEKFKDKLRKRQE